MKRKMRTLLILFGAAVLVAACSSTPPATGYSQPRPAQAQNEERMRLRHYYRSWAGTPHQMGGLSRQGIDCSGFVYVTYRDVYGKVLPRSTDQLWDIGEEVALHELRTGDLLMFKTGFKQRHVGIYVGDGEFIHASSSSGVMASNVHSEYWSDAYRGARRIALP